MSKDLLADLPQEFQAHLSSKGLVFPELTQVDLLASALSSQFLLFAGPSGTGKSTAAKALAEFFAQPHRWDSVDVQRQWATPQNFVGYYSPIAGRFLPTENLQTLTDLEGVEDHPPFLILEEANLSAPEGYFNPALNGLSHPICEVLSWPLHAAGKGVKRPDETPVPESLKFGRFPRFLGTINVDATAHAPANKVSGRACVVLLDAPPKADSSKVIDSLWGSSHGTPGVGSAAIGDPGDALNQARQSNTASQLANALNESIHGLAGALSGKDSKTEYNPVTQRDQQRCLMYMAFFQKLATSQPLGLDADTALRIGAETSVLHFVLPGLVEADFADALEYFDSNATSGGLVQARAARLLRREGQDAYGPPLDFWSAAS